MATASTSPSSPTRSPIRTVLARSRVTRPAAIAVATGLALTVSFPSGASATPAGEASDATRAVIEHWTPERIAAAEPLDLAVDSRGLAYERRDDGRLVPRGHDVEAVLEQVTGVATGVATGASLDTLDASASTDVAGTGMRAGPVGRSTPVLRADRTGPSIANRVPADGATVGTEVTFAAAVTDPSGVSGVTLAIVLPNGSVQGFAMGAAGGNTWHATISGFSEGGGWGWYLIARDGTRRGNRTTSSTYAFTVSTGGGGGSGGGGDDDTVVANARWSNGGDDDTVVANARWSNGGDIQYATGRILFETPTIRGNRVTWNGYVCSGTAVEDAITSASIIVTAAHCVYDDVSKAFARNVLFIPNQDGTSGSGTDHDCTNDPIGCWVPSHGVVDANWTTREFPANVEWDYAYYVVPTSGAHAGAGANTSLEAAVDELTVPFAAPTTGAPTHALGYSYADDPNFMYCAEPLGVETAGVDWWLGECGLTGGASGGPWIQPMDTSAGRGPIVSVNSWGYTNRPGMAGPLLDASAACVFATANDPAATPTNRGVVVAGCTD